MQADRGGPQLGDAQLDPSGVRLADPLTIAVALRQPVRMPFAETAAGLRPHLELHRALGSEAQHLPQQTGVERLRQKHLNGHHPVGHRSGRMGGHNPTLPENRR